LAQHWDLPNTGIFSAKDVASVPIRYYKMAIRLIAMQATVNSNVKNQQPMPVRYTKKDGKVALSSPPPFFV
jgi:hypothetical protein